MKKLNLKRILHKIFLNYFFKNKIMQKLTNDQKARIYNGMLRKYQKLQEEVRLIQAQNVEVSPKDQRRIQEMEVEMKKIYDSTRKLYN